MYTNVRKSIPFILALAITIPFLPAHAVTITVDGDLNDWISSPQGRSSDWTPLRTSTYSTVEDQTGNEYTYLNPGYGGQNYDAEAIYVEIADNTLYIAIVTGLSPDNIKWPAGDIAIDFGNDGSFEYGIVTLGDSGNAWGGLGDDAGEVYGVGEWNYGIWTNPDKYHPNGDSPYKKLHPTTIKSGTNRGNASLVYQQAKYDGTVPSALGNLGGDHYLIEAAVSLDLFDTSDLQKNFTVHWTMACANDWIQVDPVSARVPEPSALLLLGAGLGGIGYSRRKRHPGA